MPIGRNRSFKAIISELMNSYDKTKKIGNIVPKDRVHAYEIALAIAHRLKKKGDVREKKQR